MRNGNEQKKNDFVAIHGRMPNVTVYRFTYSMNRRIFVVDFHCSPLIGWLAE